MKTTTDAHGTPEERPHEPNDATSEPGAPGVVPAKVIFDELTYEDDAETLPNRELIDLSPILERP